MRSTDHHFHSTEQVRRYIDEAREICAALELDGRLAEIAFEKAVDLLAAKQVCFDQPAAAPLGMPLMQVPGLRR